MNQAFKKQGLTLVELILAILLLNVVLLGGISLEMGVRRIFYSSSSDAAQFNEISAIMAFITKDINRGVGWLGQLAYMSVMVDGLPTWEIRVDSNGNGIADAGDVIVGYQFDNISHQLRYYPNVNIKSNYSILSSQVESFGIDAPNDSTGFVTGVSRIYLRLRRDPSQNKSYTNPELDMESAAQYRSQSVT